MLNAHSTRRLFRKLLIAGLSVGTPLVAFVACSSGTGSVGVTEAGASETSAALQQCHTEKTDAGSACATFTLELLGDTSTCDFTDSGTASADVCDELCGRGYCRREGARVTCYSSCAVDGRRYTDLDDAGAPRAHDVGSYLARMAFFEAASVDSFALLRSALAAHGAPLALLRSCDAARRDEVRHARMAARLTRRHGGLVVAPPPPERAPLSLEALAIENAVEGCTRETFGVLIGMWQAERAATSQLRAFFGKLALDESRHAALAHRVDAWLRTMLTSAARARVDAARQAALADLARTLPSPAATVARELGLPSQAEALTLLAAWTSTREALAA